MSELNVTSITASVKQICLCRILVPEVSFVRTLCQLKTLCTIFMNSAQILRTFSSLFFHLKSVSEKNDGSS